MEYTFTKENFEKEVLQSDVPVLVDMFATWCGPCKMMAPVVEEIAKEYEGIAKVGKVDIDQDSDLAARYSIMSVPTFLIFKNGEVVDKVVGGVPKDILTQAIEKAK
ncbi:MULTISPECIES: thioredoxin [Anaerostipes]|uniref:thioredoxin n=1 Tax=Anaerostipes TaxID=207244 RepID=UPI0009525F76|nr:MULTISPECIES: thioredoxin [Anaerostipes]MCI5622588.1 thioredoxin [Anaerostipes sp.]MDY2727048.1 thioredoxin [Anaerostipes faecalis]OLR59814.1 thioredoxin [Anaerostipes sp. 494a]